VPGSSTPSSTLQGSRNPPTPSAASRASRPPGSGGRPGPEPIGSGPPASAEGGSLWCTGAYVGTWARASRASGYFTAEDLEALFEDYTGLLHKYAHTAQDAPPGAREMQLRIFYIPDEPGT
jgi:hypothetical protein